MPVIRGKDVPQQRLVECGCMLQVYPIRPIDDILDFHVVTRTMADEEKWAMQKHSHPKHDEVWYIVKGSGKMIEGDEEYDVGPGDLIIIPRGVPHKIIGDVTFTCHACKHNVYGETCGTKLSFMAHDAPYREKPEEMSKVGEYMEVDLLAVYKTPMP